MEQKKSMELDLWSFNKIQKIICFLLFYFWGLGVMVFYATFIDIYFSYIVEVSFIGEGNQSTQRKPLTCRKSVTNFITRKNGY
jgi:hypothetical protein